MQTLHEASHGGDSSDGTVGAFIVFVIIVAIAMIIGGSGGGGGYNASECARSGQMCNPSGY